MLTKWGNTPTKHTSREKYTRENIYAIGQSSIGYLAWSVHVSERGPDSGQIPLGHECATKQSGHITDSSEYIETYSAYHCFMT